MKYLNLLSLLVLSSCASNQKNLTDFGIAKINPLFEKTYLCAEHAVEKMGIGDVFGRDCMVTDFVTNKNGKWQKFYKNRGLKNTDWFSWRANVLAPFDGTVVDVSINNKVNKPGTPIRSRASAIIMKNDDGVMLLFAHIREPLVKKGDQIQKGQAIAKVGNNGNAWMPHIHIGAWKEKRPLQIVFDLKAWEQTIQKLYPEMYKEKESNVKQKK